uniref:Cilia- and flagella-associated protein 52 n=1 Tax=Pygocentrus nattereri TaxID=42514 RepID=A0AAR2J7L3_PYGNA
MWWFHIAKKGHVLSGLQAHPDREHLIYPLGCTLIIKHLKSGKQGFLHGHTNNISCLTVSKSGRYIASGQVTFMGFKADVIIWDYTKREIYAQFTLHKAKVEALVFSPNEKYLLTLGGQDDGSIVLWNVEKKEAICGSPASAHSAGHCLTVGYSSHSDNIFISAGNRTLRVWELDLPNRKIRPTECQTGQLKRIIKCIEIPEDDSFFYCGTTSGDIMKVNLKSRLLSSCGPVKQKFSKGVNALKMLKTGDLLVGSGDGAFSLCSSNNFKIIKRVELEGGVSSVALRGEGQQVFVGTDAAQIYCFGYTDFKPELISTNHSSAVWDTAFPQAVKIWISSTPLIIHNAHSMGVTAIVSSGDSKRLISGGGEGQVRVWDILQDSYKLVATMKEHKASVNAIKIKSNNQECVTASSDGACIIWDLLRFVRNQMVLANTLFRTVCYHPEEYQIITSGTDRKIGYWEVYDGSAIRELEGSLTGAINGMDISQEGGHFVTGGDEKLIKVWHYFDGDVTHVGVGHSGSISSVRICPNNRFIISTSTDGAILIWRYPHSS